MWRWLFRWPLLFLCSLFLSLQLSTCFKHYCFLDKVLHTTPLTFSLSLLSQEIRSQFESQAVWGSPQLWECRGWPRAVECRAGCLYLEASTCGTVWLSSMWTMRCKGLGSMSPGHPYFLDIPCQFRGRICESEYRFSGNSYWNVDWSCTEYISSWGIRIHLLWSSVSGKKKEKKYIAHGSISTLIVKDIVSSISKHPDE